jgi:hypothetical protein
LKIEDTKRLSTESVLQYYQRLKDCVKENEMDLEKSEIYELLFGEPVSPDHARKALRTLDLTLEADACYMPHEKDQDIDMTPNKTTVEINKDGTQSSSKLIRMKDEESKDANFLLKAHGYDLEVWELVSARSNIWNAYSKQDGIMELYSSKIVVKLKTVDWSVEEIDKYFMNKEFKNAKQLTQPTNYDANGEILEIDLPDLHAGLFSWRKETMEDYDIHIAKKNFLKCMNDILERCYGRKFKKIIFATLGDLLHVDNDNQTTSKGTLQQVDGRIPKVFDITLDMLIDAVELLGNFAPLEIIYVPGNHDKTLGYALMKALEKAFRNDNNIVFDMSPNPRKYRRFENVLIGWLHGDCSKNNISEWLQVEARKDFGDSLFAEVHAGHYHHTQTLEKSGMIVRYLPTICASSAWEHQRGYSKNVKSIISFVWNTVSGLREMWFSNI